MFILPGVLEIFWIGHDRADTFFPALVLEEVGDGAVKRNGVLAC